MVFSCFGSRASGAHPLAIDHERPEAPRPTSTPVKKTTRYIKRQGSDGSRVSTTSSKSNESISKLPPCARVSDPKIESMMMPLPHDPRPSRCLRLSHPKTYSALVSDMKSTKGCRDWRNFAVFPADDVDMNVSADDAARRKALDYQRKLQQLSNSFSDFDTPPSSIQVDMIG